MHEEVYNLSRKFLYENCGRQIIGQEKLKRYPCNQCDYQAKHQSGLKTHIQSLHEHVKYACNQCDYRATTQSSLTAHIQFKHEGVKYACNQCDHQATTKGSLKRHEKICTLNI